MRKYLPITLILLAALSGQAFGAVEQLPAGGPAGLSALVRLAQCESAGGAQLAARSPSLTVLAGGLTMLVWLDGSDDPGLSLAPRAACDAQCRRGCLRPQQQALPSALARMRPPVLRGP